MGLLDGMSEKELKKIGEAEFITRKLPYMGNMTFMDKMGEIIDKTTGVRYIVCLSTSHNFTITPRLNADGTVMTVNTNELNDI